jgi:hypothetical protein
MDHRLDNGGDAEPPPPQLPRHERDRPLTQEDTEDGNVLEDRTRRQIGDLLPIPPTVRARARARTTSSTLQIRVLYESAGCGATVFIELLKVVTKIERQ